MDLFLSKQECFSSEGTSIWKIRCNCHDAWYAAFTGGAIFRMRGIVSTRHYRDRGIPCLELFGLYEPYQPDIASKQHSLYLDAF